MDNLDKDIRMAEKLGYGVHYGAFKADYPNTKEKTPEQIDPDLQPCLWCGMLFRKDPGRRKLFCCDVCRRMHHAQKEHEETNERRLRDGRSV